MHHINTPQVEQDRFLRKPFEETIPRALPAPRDGLTLAPVASVKHDSAHLTPSSLTRSNTFGAPRMQSLRSAQPSNGAVPEESDQAQWASGTLAPHFWAPLSSAGFKVRGPKYLAVRRWR